MIHTVTLRLICHPVNKIFCSGLERIHSGFLGIELIAVRIALRSASRIDLQRICLMRNIIGGPIHSILPIPAAIRYFIGSSASIGDIIGFTCIGRFVRSQIGLQIGIHTARTVQYQHDVAGGNDGILFRLHAQL